MRFSHLIKLAEHIFLNSQYNLLAIHLAGFSANLPTRKLRLMSSLYKDYYPLVVQAVGASSLVFAMQIVYSADIKTKQIF